MRALTPLQTDAENGALFPSARQPRGDRRVEVSAISRARTPHGERTIRIAGLSSRTALLLSAEPLGWAGQCIDVDVPVLGGRDLTVMAGVARTERFRDGHATTVEFLVIDTEMRLALNDLLALLLGAESQAGASEPRCVYDVAVAYGPMAQRRAHLQEISLSGLSLRIAERLAHDFVIEVTVPTLRGKLLSLHGRVTGQRLSAEGGYVTTLDFEPLDGPRRATLGELIADLMCR
ncbi:MAG TPA: hypothetical protein VGL86_23155 [Polyangia bacterium]|jgi:hypothetical protein